jgi:hypothetical protein
MVTLTITSIGEDRFIRAFNRIGSEVRDFSEPFGEIYTDFVELEGRNFDAEGTPNAFRALTPKYAEWKLKHFGVLPIMVLRGTLRASLAGLGGSAMGEGAVREIHPMDAYFGTTVPYARKHQYSGREIVQLSEEDKKRWAMIVQRWALVLMRSAMA